MRAPSSVVKCDSPFTLLLELISSRADSAVTNEKTKVSARKTCLSFFVIGLLSLLQSEVVLFNHGLHQVGEADNSISSPRLDRLHSTRPSSSFISHKIAPLFSFNIIAQRLNHVLDTLLVSQQR